MKDKNIQIRTIGQEEACPTPPAARGSGISSRALAHEKKKRSPAMELLISSIRTLNSTS